MAGGWYLPPNLIVRPMTYSQQLMAIAAEQQYLLLHQMQEAWRTQQPVDTPYAGGIVRSVPGHPEQQVWMGSPMTEERR
jgi:hypothetical protein